MVTRPSDTSGMRHIAIFCLKFTESLKFYTEIIGMKIEWQPDSDNVYLTSGNDNLALHRAVDGFVPNEKQQYLDHIGFILSTPNLVDEWFIYMKDCGVEIITEPRTHRDGAKSFYCKDPDGRRVQMIFHPPIA